MDRSTGPDPAADPFGFDALDLDTLRRRRSVKWHGRPDLVGAWVADMDLRPAEVVLEAIRAATETADFGYPDWTGSGVGSPAVDVFVERARRRYGLAVAAAETREFLDVVQAVQVVFHTMAAPGDGVVLHMPAYPPLWRMIESMHLRRVDVPAVVGPDGVSFDYDDLERRLAREGARFLLLCHPHNPTGHRFDRPELERLADIAERFDLLIVSDEIHADLTYGPARHLPIAALSQDIARRTVTVHSASKAFNLAGLRHAIAHLGPAEVRTRIAALPNHLLGALNVLAVDATVAAWTAGDPWLEAVLAHLDRNRRLVADMLARSLPEVRYRIPDATYLAWLDCTGLDRSGHAVGSEPVEVFERRGVRLSPGLDYGPQGAGHVRLNMATSRQVLELVVAMMAGDAPPLAPLVTPTAPQH